MALVAVAAIVTGLSGPGAHPRVAIGVALLLAAPIVYGFDSRAASASYLGVAVAWLAVARMEPGSALGYWVFWAIALPRALAQLRVGRRDGQRGLLAWALLGSAVAGCLYSVEIRVRDVAALLFPAVFAVLFLYGARRIDEEPALEGIGAALARPARLLGGLGVGLSLLAYCFAGAWGFAGVIDPPGVGLLDLGTSLGLSLCFGALALRGALEALRARRWHRMLVGLYPLVVLPGLAIVHLGGSLAAGALLMRSYAALLAVSAAAAWLGAPRVRAGGAGGG